MTEPHIRQAGDSGILLELDAVIDARVNDRVIGIARAVREADLAGVRDVVPAYQSVAVHFDPLVTDLAALESVLRVASRAAVTPTQGATVDVPVVYGGEAGPDLPEVAAWAGLGEAEVIELHTHRPYRVFMLGFLPGFAYLGPVESRIAAPRRSTPRVHVPAGSVGIAGVQTGIYSRDSPGGWQIIGRTPLVLFDPARSPAATFSPGDTVRFVPAPRPVNRVAERDGGGARREGGSRTSPVASRTITILHPGLHTTIQDAGRWGHQAIGVPVGGALDPLSHRVANAALGNDRGDATLEVTLSGPVVRFSHDGYIAVAGADLGAALDGAPLPMNRAVQVRAGTVLEFGRRRRGARAYLAFDGGIAVPPVLGSRATHVRSVLGGLDGRALRAGDEVVLGPAPDVRPHASARAVASLGESLAHVPRVERDGSHASVARLRVLPGPHDYLFPSTALDLLQRSRFVVTPLSDRMGYRLSGARILVDAPTEMISTATFPGGLQVPPSGDPILLMADRQTTGGYPQIATVISADQPAAGQLAPGDWVEFHVCSRSEALAAIAAQEGLFRALA